VKESREITEDVVFNKQLVILVIMTDFENQLVDVQ